MQTAQDSFDTADADPSRPCRMAFALLVVAGHHRRDDDDERDQHMQEPLSHGKELLRRRLDFKMEASSPSTRRDAGLGTTRMWL